MKFRRLGANEFEELETGDTFEIRGADALPITKAIALFQQNKDSRDTMVVKNPKNHSNHYIVWLKHFAAA